MTTKEDNQPTKNVSWEQFDKAMDNLARKIIGHEKKRGKKFKGIYAIPRGGLSVGVALSHRLGIPMTAIFIQPDIILVDEISDKGKTLDFHLRNNPFIDDLLAVTWYVRKGSIGYPDLYDEEIDTNDWIVFPWERWANNKEEE